jgi:hypothetical protein
MPRFVVLRHDCPTGFVRPPHWDFMLEIGGTLRTWALAAEPCASQAAPAQRLADHRLAYLDYEGPISGDRGSVSRWDRGSYQLVRETADELIVTVIGQRLQGQVELSRIQGASAAQSDRERAPGEAAAPRASHLWRFSFLAAPATRD